MCKIDIWKHLSQSRCYSRMTSTCIHVICIADIWDVVTENGRCVISLGVVTRLWADNLGIVVWFPGTGRGFFLLRSGQTSAVAHPITMAFSLGVTTPPLPHTSIFSWRAHEGEDPTCTYWSDVRNRSEPQWKPVIFSRENTEGSEKNVREWEKKGTESYKICVSRWHNFVNSK